MNDMILRDWNGFQIRQREDGYLCLTDMATASGKLLGDWTRLGSTKDLISVLSHKYGISHDILITSQKYHGTYGHKKVAIAFATWCSPEFFAQVIDWTEELLTRGMTYIESQFDENEIAQLEAVIVDRDARLIASQKENAVLKKENAELTSTIITLSCDHLYQQAMERFFIQRVQYKKGEFIRPSDLTVEFQKFWRSLGGLFEELPQPTETEVINTSTKHINQLKEQMKATKIKKVLAREPNVFVSTGGFLEGCVLTEFAYPEDSFYSTVGTFIDNY